LRARHRTQRLSQGRRASPAPTLRRANGH
jgi:hypothetical protein